MRKTVVFSDGSFVGSHLSARMLSLAQDVVLVDDGPEYLVDHDEDSGRVHHVRTPVDYTVGGIESLLTSEQPDCIVHCIDVPADKRKDGVSHRKFIANSDALLAAASLYWQQMSAEDQSSFRYVMAVPYNIYGALEGDAVSFDEHSRYFPSSLYAAAAASADMLAMARSFVLPITTVVHSTLYGLGQGPNDSMVSYVVSRAFDKKTILLSGSGKYTRDFLYIDDFCEGLLGALRSGKAGERYCVGSGEELSLAEATASICDIISSLGLSADLGVDVASLVKFGGGSASYDKKRVLNCSKAQHELGFERQYSFERGVTDYIGELVARSACSNA